MQAEFRAGARLMSAVLLAAALLAGCATLEKPTAPPADPLAECRMLYREADAAIERAGVRDQGPALVDGFSYLRATRFFAAFRDELGDDPINEERWSAWAGHLAALDAEARALELRNLPAPAEGRGNDILRDELDRCRALLLTADAAEAARRVTLREAVRVPDDYVGWWRVAGLYPFTAPFVAASIAAWHAETRAVYATPLVELPVAGELVRWAPVPVAAPLDAAQVSEILRNARDQLGIPWPAAADLDRLFDTYAPVWEVDVAADDDLIGMLHWDAGLVADTARPTLYRKISHARFGDRVLLQLNYIVWFPTRPGNDIYAGHLDGIDWRVTLGPDGEPWLFDAIHNCGCYHEFFPSRHLRLRDDLPTGYFEPPLLPQPAPEQRPLVLRIAHRTHFIQRVYHDASLHDASPLAAQPMEWEDYDALRSLPAGDGYRSVFGAHGLVDGTQRSERFLLWPMGVRSPGAMRQWGRHATAFVGRRHFDDPFLIQSLFEEAP